MVGRNLWFIAILVAAIAFPYYLSADSQWTSLRNFWNSMWTDTVDGDPYAGQPPLWPNANQNVPTASASPAPAIAPLYSNSAGAAQALTPPATRGLEGTPGPYHGHQAAGAATNTPVKAAAPPTQRADPFSQQPSLCGPATSCISYLINFEATPAWVMNNWRRVSTRLAEFELEGLRVPVVTGTASHDMVGSLTYYFDRRQILQRIAFDGYTGDPSPFASIMMQKYGLQAEPWLGAGLYLARGGKDKQDLVSVLRIRHAPVVRSDNPRQRYHVEFELNRPETELGLSSHFESLLKKDREQSVWKPEAEATETTDGEKDVTASPPQGEASESEESALTSELAEIANEASASAATAPTNPYPSKSQLPINADRYLPPPY